MGMLGIYQPVKTSADMLEEQQDLQFYQHRARPSYIRVAGPWIMSTLLMLVVLATSHFRQPHQATLLPGAPTDAQDARSAIAYGRKAFQSGLFYNETLRDVDFYKSPGQPKYIGTPSNEIDAAWEDLMMGEPPLLCLLIGERLRSQTSLLS